MVSRLRVSSSPRRSLCPESHLGLMPPTQTILEFAANNCFGNPKGFHLSCGQAHDLEGTNLLLEAILDQIQALLVDKDYVAKARPLKHLEQRQVEEVISPKSNQKEP